MARERHLLAVFRDGCPEPAPGWLGPGDDACASPPIGEWLDRRDRLVLTTDGLEEDLHFRRSWQSARDLAYRLLAVNLSDLAAMGARPLGYLLALTWPEDRPADEARELARGLRAAEDELRCPLLGGDTDVASAGARLRLTATVLGHATEPMRRDGGRAGDALFVSGPVGGAAAVVDAYLRGSPPDDAPPAWADALRRFRRPVPRLDLGASLAGRAHAAIDLSDGLAPDLESLARASGLAARLELDAVPVHDVVRGRSDGRALALEGGEDYELLVAGPAGLAQMPGLVRVGSLLDGPPGDVELVGELP